MGKRGPLAMVTPDEFRSRTSLTLSSRSGTTLKVDAAYDAYYGWRTDENAGKLHTALREYLVGHGGYWAHCERDKVSGGLLEWLFKFTAPAPVPTVLGREDSLDARARARIDEYEIPHSRFGVLYLLGNIDIELNLLSIGLEGVAAVGGAVGSGLATDMGKLHLKDASKGTGVVVYGRDVSAQQVVNAGSLAFKVAPKAAPKLAGIVGHRHETRARNAMDTTLRVSTPIDNRVSTASQLPAAVPVPVEAFPATVSALMLAAEKVTEAYSHGRYYGHAAATGMALAAPVVLTGTLLADAGAKLWRTIHDAVVQFKDWLWNKLVTKIGMSGYATTIATIVKAAAKFLVDMLMKSAAPLVGSVMELGRGLARTFEAARNRIGAYLDRKKIRVVAGHPEEIANSIESAMTQGVFMGLLDVLKGVGKTAVQALLPGLGTLVSAVMTAIEWLIKFVCRLVENYCIKKFLEIARGYYEIEKRRATTEPSTDPDAKRQRPGRLKPNVSPGGIITDTARFTEFFKLGCEASPLVAMLTLNAGICGSLMTLARMFDDSGAMIKVGAHGQKKNEQFDVAGRYFARLKEYGSGYLKNSGFKFRARDPDNTYIKGLLHHAVEHHKSKFTVGGAIVSFVAAA